MTSQNGGLKCHIFSIENAKIAAILSGTIATAAAIVNPMHNATAAAIVNPMHNAAAAVIANLMHNPAAAAIAITIHIAHPTAEDPEENAVLLVPRAQLVVLAQLVLLAQLVQRE